MKVLHTSDWHLGHVLYNYDRRGEQTCMLEQMARIAGEERADVMIVSGDVFHTAQPSSGVQKMLVDGILAIRRVAPDMPIVLTAGNHDSASRLDVHAGIWEELGVTVRGQLDKADPERHIVEIPGKGWVVAIPYCNDRNLPDGFIQGLLDRVRERNVEGLPVVMCAHATVTGCDVTGHDDVRDLTVGGIDSYSVEEFGEGYDYLALGHIHKPQTLHGCGGKVRYSGTPVAVSFSENYPHTVTVAEVTAGERPQIREVEIRQEYPLITIPATGAMSWEDALEELTRFDSAMKGYVRLNVMVGPANPLPPQAHQMALGATAEKECRFCLINAVREEPIGRGERCRLTVSEFKAIDPLELARRYGDDTGNPMDEDMVRIFASVVESLKEEERTKE